MKSNIQHKNLVDEISKGSKVYIGRTLWMTVYDSKRDILYPYQDIRPVEFMILPEILYDKNYNGEEFSQSLLKDYMRVKDNKDGKFKKKGARLLKSSNKLPVGVFEKEEDALEWYLLSKASQFRFKGDRLNSLINELNEIDSFIDSKNIADEPDWSCIRYIRADN